jgi:hypothetical protein
MVPVYEEVAHQLSTQLRYADHSALPMAVATANPELFQTHVLPFLDSASKRSLNASCQFASTQVRSAVSCVTFGQSTYRQMNGMAPKLPEKDPTARYPAITTLDLDFSDCALSSPSSFHVLRSVAGFPQLLQQLKHLKVGLRYYMSKAVQPEWWLELVDNIVRQCVQLQSFTIQNLLNDVEGMQGVATFTWKAQLGDSEQLHDLLSDLAAIQMPHGYAGVVSAGCSLQSLSEIRIDGGDLMTVMLPSLARCSALVKIDFTLGEGFRGVAKDVLNFAVSLESLEDAHILLTDCHPVFDRNDEDDQALLLKLATSTKDLRIHLEAADTEADYVASNLMLLCDTPSVYSLRLNAGEQQEHMCTSHSWRHFSLLHCLHLTDVLLDDSCVAALNCLTLLEEWALVFSKLNSLHKFLTLPIELPRLQELEVVLETDEASTTSSGTWNLEEVSAAEAWQGSRLVTDMLLLADNLLSMLRTPLLAAVKLMDGVVTAHTFVQLQQRSPRLQLGHPHTHSEIVVLVEDTQLAAVAKHCPQLLANGSCRFKGITHYGLMSAAVTTGHSLTELCGAHSGYTKDAFLPNLPIPVQGDDSSIMAVAQHCTNLTRLQLHSTTKVFTKQSVVHIAAHLPLPRVLELLGCTGMDDSCLFALVRGCRELDHLSLDGLSSVSEAAICVALLQLPRLVFLSLVEAGRFTIAGLRSLLTGSRSLQHVRLPSAAPAWQSEFKRMPQEQLDGWGAGNIARAWKSGHHRMLHIQRGPAVLQL